MSGDGCFVEESAEVCLDLSRSGCHCDVATHLYGWETACFGEKGIPYITTFERCTIGYLYPLIKANDTIKIEIETGKVVEFIKLNWQHCYGYCGRNRGRIGIIKHREKHKGSFEILHVQDTADQEFATQLGNVFTIGKGIKPWVTLPRGKGIKLSIVEEAKKKARALKGVVA
ncbi:hypothetical protein GOP47_0027668 [Adiantum capillus-veneris]|nr:hypothetical protein GOP47_0027668 [Adiantum capillus-veneris]